MAQSNHNQARRPIERTMIDRGQLLTQLESMRREWSEVAPAGARVCIDVGMLFDDFVSLIKGGGGHAENQTNF